VRLVNYNHRWVTQQAKCCVIHFYFMENEVWKVLSNIATSKKYEVSNLGRIKSFTSNRKHPNGYIKKPFISSKGYAVVSIGLLGGAKNMYVHRIVAIEFIENTMNKACVNHKNGDKKDNKVSNLEWVSDAENNIHAIESGLNKFPPVKIIDTKTGVIYKSKKEAKKAKAISQRGMRRIKDGKSYNGVKVLSEEIK